MQMQMADVSDPQGDWVLDADEIVAMHEFGIRVAAEKADRVDALGEVADVEDFEAIFGAMSFDGGYDGIEGVVPH